MSIDERHDRKSSGLFADNIPVLIVVLIALTIGSAVLSLMIGRYWIDPGTIFSIILHPIIHSEKTWTPTVETVIMDVRLPRVIAGLLVGSGLAICGAAYQGLFRNPLVSSEILGVSSGAGFGAAIAIILSELMLVIQVSSFIFGLIAVGLTYWIARVNRQTPILMLILSGIVVGSLFTAMTSICKYVADPMNKMPTIIFWLLGSLNHATGYDILVLGPVIFICIILLLLIRWRINLISMGDEDAKALGVNTEHIKIIIILTTTLITAASVTMCGLVGWIGLVIPHIGRILVGPDNRHLLPVTVLIGAIFLVMVDTIARTLTSAEIPIGLLTAAIGAPLFAILIRVSRIGW
jgi:iron complex transport system permease protein